MTSRTSSPQHGPRLTPEGALFQVWAPQCERLRLQLGDRSPLGMMREPEGWFRLEVPGARHGDRYTYLLPDGRSLPDPASRRQPDGVHGPSQLWDPGLYGWRHPSKGLPLHALAFYELHVGTFTAEGTLDAAAGRLPDLAALGITCVELLPLQPFPGARNWGYDGVAPHAVHEPYGGPDALQRFVDAAHGAGLTVCLDVVYNHYGPEGNYQGAYGPYLTSRHRSPWGDGLDYDGAPAQAVRGLALEAARAWVRDFRMDALRLDAVHGIADGSPRHLVAELAAEVHDLARAQGREVQVIAESDLEDRKVVEPPPVGWGCDAMWSDDFHHAVHALVTGERYAFLRDFGETRHLVRALSEGFVYQGEPSDFRGAPRGTSTAGLSPARFVIALQNHDQVGNRPLGERLPALVPREALWPLAALLCLGPGLPLLFMGEEYGEEHPFLYFTSHGDPDLARSVSEGRRAEHHHAGAGEEVPDPQAPETQRRSVLSHRRDGHHGELWRHHQALLALRRRHAEHLAGAWPEVAQEGRAFTLRRPGLDLSVNLGAEPAGGLPGWGWRVKEWSRSVGEAKGGLQAQRAAPKAQPHGGRG